MPHFWHCFWGDVNRIYSPQISKSTHQSKDTPGVQCIAVSYRNRGEGLFTGIWVRGVLKEQKWLKDSYISKAHPSRGGSSQKLETWHVLQSVGSSAGWRVPFVGNSVGSSLFHVACLVSASSGQINLSESIFQKSLLVAYVLGWRDPVNLVSFRDFLETLSCLLPEGKE